MKIDVKEFTGLWLRVAKNLFRVVTSWLSMIWTWNNAPKFAPIMKGNYLTLVLVEFNLIKK